MVYIDNQRLGSIVQEKLKVRPGMREALGLAEELVLVMEVGELLRDANAASLAKSLVTGSDFNVYHTVPAGKRWHLRFAMRVATTGSTTVYLKVGADEIRLGAIQTGEQFFPALNYLLDAGDQVGLANTGNAADTSVSCQIIYEEEDARR